MLRYWITLGAAIALMTAMTAPVAGAQPEDEDDDSGVGLALGHHRVLFCHKGQTLLLPPPAVGAHVKHHEDDRVGPCEEPFNPPPECNTENPIANLPVEVRKEGGDPEVVEIGDLLSIEGDFEVGVKPVSVTLGDAEATEGTFTDSDDATDNADIAQEGEELLIDVKGEPVNASGEPVTLKTENLAGVTSDGISCLLEEDEAIAEPEGTTEDPYTTQAEGPAAAEADDPESESDDDALVPPGLQKKMEK